MKFLVLGATGMAGHTIAIYLQEQGHDVTAFSRTKIKYCNCIVGDIKDLQKLGQTIKTGNYDVVINCVGVLNQNAEADKYDATLINSLLPHFIVEKIKHLPTKFIHMSTDCVFSGKTGSYVEDALRDGETFYDRSKALGEVVDAKNLTFRNSIVGPDMKKEGIGLFNWFMQQEGNINGYKSAIWTGVTTLTLAKAIERAAQEDITGLYHLVNDRAINKFELLLLFNKVFRQNKIDVCPSEAVVVDKSLICTRNDFDFEVPTYEDMIIEMKQWIDTHKELYPHYFREEIQ